MRTQAQNAYDARLQLISIDTAAAIACYDLQISNPGDELWDLANYNINLFYDAAAACYRSDELLAPGNVYRGTVRNDVVGPGQVSGSGLPFEDSLGSLRLGLSFVEGGVGETVDTTAGVWLSTISVCFDIKFSDITDPSTCFEIHFNNLQIQNALGTFPDIMQQWISNDMTAEVNLNNTENIVPNASRTSCFVLAEDTETLCSDGIDNDEDGLLDCLDDECSPGPIDVVSPPIQCFDPLGTIDLRGSSQGLTYSIDGGMTFSTDSLYTDLTPGLYDIEVLKNDVSFCSFAAVISLQAPDCNEADEMSCMDNIDNDGDGLIDCEDDSCLPVIDSVDIIIPMTCPGLSDGIIDIMTSFPNVMYSIDSGRTYLGDPLFSNLPEGAYHIFIRNAATLCEISYANNPVMLTATEVCVTPDEDCQDGVDNDLDGLTDCADPDCSINQSCFMEPTLFIPNIISINSSNNNVFSIQSPEAIDIQSLSIYDRWGNQIYHRESLIGQDIDQGWDGTVQNRPVDNGVYIYQATLVVAGNSIHRTGDITVVN